MPSNAYCGIQFNGLNSEVVLYNDTNRLLYGVEIEMASNLSDNFVLVVQKENDETIELPMEALNEGDFYYTEMLDCYKASIKKTTSGKSSVFFASLRLSFMTEPQDIFDPTPTNGNNTVVTMY